MLVVTVQTGDSLLTWQLWYHMGMRRDVPTLIKYVLGVPILHQLSIFLGAQGYFFTILAKNKSPKILTVSNQWIPGRLDSPFPIEIAFKNI